MKFTATDIETLRSAIVPLDTNDARRPYRDGTIVAVKDIDRRYRWDLFWAARGPRIIDLEPYADAHIDTALRAIVPPLS